MTRIIVRSYQGPTHIVILGLAKSSTEPTQQASRTQPLNYPPSDLCLATISERPIAMRLSEPCAAC